MSASLAWPLFTPSIMVDSDAILAVQKPVDQSLRETSAWLRVTAQAAAAREASKPGAAA